MENMLINAIISNHLILENICKYLDIPDLLNLYEIGIFRHYMSNYIIKYFSENDWKIVSLLNLSDKFIIKFSYKIDWILRVKYYNIPDEILDSMIIREETMKEIINFIPVTKKILKKFGDFIDWELASKKQRIPEQIIIERKKEIYKYKILKYQDLSEKFLEDYLDEDSSILLRICVYQRLSESFIVNIDNIFCLNTLEYVEPYYSVGLLAFQTLSGEFIKRHINFDNKYNVIIALEYANLSEQFIIDVFLERYMKEIVMHKRNLSEDFLMRYIKNNIPDSLILQYQNLSEDFILKNIHLSGRNKNLIAKFQNVSDNFILKYFKKQETISTLLKYKKLSENCISQLIERGKISCSDRLLLTNQIVPENILEKAVKTNLYTVLKYQRLSENFINKHIKVTDYNSSFIISNHNVSYDFAKKYLPKYLNRERDFDLTTLRLDRISQRLFIYNSNNQFRGPLMSLAGVNKFYNRYYVLCGKKEQIINHLININSKVRIMDLDTISNYNRCVIKKIRYNGKILKFRTAMKIIKYLENILSEDDEFLFVAAISLKKLFKRNPLKQLF